MRVSIVVVLGEFPTEVLASLEQALEGLSLELRRETGALSGEQAQPERDVAAVLLPDTSPETLGRVEELRSRSEFARTPIFAIAVRPSVQEFSSSLGAGVDDLIAWPVPAAALRARLEPLTHAAQAPFVPARGQALVVGGAERARAARARTLSSAGFEVTAAETALGEPWQTDLRLGLAVVGLDAAAIAFDLAERARAAGSMCRFVFCVDAREAKAGSTRAKTLDGVRLLDRTAPAESVVFLANEMAQSSLLNQRTSHRVLHPALVRFGPLGAPDAALELGISYDVSQGGLYVRTTAPAKTGSVSLRVQLEDGAFVALEGRVAWWRGLSYDGQAAAPPGFGVKLEGGTTEALEAFRALGRVD